MAFHKSSLAPGGATPHILGLAPGIVQLVGFPGKWGRTHSLTKPP
ncbi:hypothetical protein TCCBUS3UF1_5510 [Thermus sp. CCB_US3_UF1]|nr:hypothetical protein TCCBUS3UF1_5510 [Thermus sp. CCB_US3_UF1]